MGISDFLKYILADAGRQIDLRAYSSNNVSASNTTDTEETLRIAVDASDLIYKASMVHGEMLADARHLSDYGRNQLLYEQQQQQGQTGDDTKSAQTVQDFIDGCCKDIIQKLQAMQDYAEILVVLDGQTPPVKLETTEKRREKRAKEEQERDRDVDADLNDDDTRLKRRLRANRSAGAGNAHYGTLIDAIIDSLRKNQIPFLVAPYEADGMLAFLQQECLVDLIVTEDSDLIAYKCESGVPILYKLGNPAYIETTNSPDTLSTMSQGILLGPDELNGATKNVLAKDAPKRNLRDFSGAMMACVFAAAGCDYCSNLPGIGIVTAIRLVRAAFLDGANNERTDGTTPLGRLFAKLFEKTWDKTLSDDQKEEFQRNFLNAIYMFRHNLVYNPLTGQCRPLRIRPDPELVSFGPYRTLCHGDDEQAQLRRAAIVGEMIPVPLVTYVAEGWLCPKTLLPRTIYGYDKIPDYVQAALAGDTADDETLEEPESQDKPVANTGTTPLSSANLPLATDATTAISSNTASPTLTTPQEQDAIAVGGSSGGSWGEAEEQDHNAETTTDDAATSAGLSDAGVAGSPQQLDSEESDFLDIETMVKRRKQKEWDPHT